MKAGWRDYCLDFYIRASPKRLLLPALEEPLTPEEPSLRVPRARCPPLQEDAGWELSCPFTLPLPATLNEGSPSPPFFVISKENLLLQQEVRNLSGLLNLLPN